MPGFPAYAFSVERELENGLVIPGTDPNHAQLARTLMKWSRWELYGPKYHHFYAMYGRAVLTAVSRDTVDPLRPVVIDVRDPGNTILVYDDKWSAWPNLLITVERRSVKLPGQTELQEGEYAVVVTPDEVLTFFEGEPYNEPKRADGSPGRKARENNELGFVPAREAIFRDLGDNEQHNVFSSVTPLLVTVNKLATFIMGTLGQFYAPQAFVSGVDRGDEDMEFGNAVWYGPEGSDAKLLTADLDIAGASKFVETVHQEVKHNLPELLFDDVRGINRIAVEGLELQFSELISKMALSRPGSDNALNDILKVSLWAAQEAGHPLFAGVTTAEPDTEEWEEWTLELDPLRGYVPFGESTLVQLEMQKTELAIRKKTLENLNNQGQELLSQMQNTASRAGSSAPVPQTRARGPEPEDNEQTDERQVDERVP